MTISTEQNEKLSILAKILLRCFLLGVFFLLFWLGMILVAGNFAYQIHSSMFDITRHDFDLMNYYGMAIFKLTTFLLFLIPYLAIRLVQRSES